MTGKTEETAQQRPQPEPKDELTGPEPPRLDVVFGTLRNKRRRWVLRYLEGEESATIGELAEHIAAIENDISQREVNSKQRKRVYVSLYQSHLSALDEAGAVSYDRDRGTVELTAEADEFLTVLDHCRQVESSSASATPFYHRAETALLVAVSATAFVWTVGGNVVSAVIGVVATVAVIGVAFMRVRR